MSSKWKEYKDFIHSFINDNGQALFRGQSNSNWSLSTSFHRVMKQNTPNMSIYQNIMIHDLHDKIQTIEPRYWNIQDPCERASFIAFLQHNGFPTPLLDFTQSPYIAAYFAVEDINTNEPESDDVVIYIFDYIRWQNDFKAIYDFNSEDLHVSALFPLCKGNKKMLLQQGAFVYTNVYDIESFVKTKETDNKKYLYKFLIPAKERPVIIKELNLMGISAMTLFSNIEGVCKKAKEDFFPASVGMTASEKLNMYMKIKQAMNTSIPSGSVYIPKK